MTLYALLQTNPWVIELLLHLYLKQSAKDTNLLCNTSVCTTTCGLMESNEVTEGGTFCSAFAGSCFGPSTYSFWPFFTVPLNTRAKAINTWSSWSSAANLFCLLRLVTSVEFVWFSFSSLSSFSSTKTDFVFWTNSGYFSEIILWIVSNKTLDPCYLCLFILLSSY